MLKKSEQFEQNIFPEFHGGEGATVAYHLFTDAEKSNPRIRLASKIVLEPGCSVGVHPHEKDEEIIYILEGVATINDNGTEVLAYPGDAAICGGGKSHGVVNRGDRPLSYLAFIINN